METVLVLTNSQDGEHTASVVEKIHRLGGKVFRLDVDILSRGDVKIIFSANSTRWGFVLQTQDEKVRFDEIKSVWYRRPNFFNFQINDPVQKHFAETELKNFLEGLWYGLQEAFWMNRPHNLERARKKLYQLKIAREIGFLIPDTIVTNDPEKVKKFFFNHNGRVIFKTIWQSFLDYGDKAFNIPTTFLTSEHVSKLNLVNSLPSLFQEYIEKISDARVTIVGSDIFAVEIKSQVYSETLVDWRKPEYFDRLIHQPITLPNEVSSLCLKMMEILGLSFSAFDFAITPEGKFVFFEVNPNGQWYWIEYLTHLPISQTIAQLLLKSHSSLAERR